ncbi:hypothetical protein ACIQF6_24700 [Kitasatospora sp. NPDC092948]|uniref:hypothetical protein n=1 Tax=Kitasatospora sp. NPDC092948 TaxID=3364088 RepID=UPI00380AF83F
MSVRVAGLLVAEAVALLVLLAAAAAVASPDDMGRAGRALTVACGGVTESRSPWPGGFYGIPAVVSLAAATAACGWALRRIAQRPGGEGERRTRSSAIVAAWGALVSAQLSGVGFTAAAALRGTACVGTAGAVAGWVLWPLGLLAVVTFAWCLSAVAGRR